MDTSPGTPPAPTTLVAEIADLAPEALVERLRALAPDVQAAYAPNSRRSQLADLRIWSAWCRARGEPSLPATLDGLRAFLEDAIARGRKRATLNHYVATLALVHRLAEAPWPLHTQQGLLMWRGLRKRLPARQRQAAGLTVDRIETMLAMLDSGELRDLRDAALLALGYESMCRASELVGINVDDLSAEGDGSARLLIRRSKTDQEGQGALLYVSPESWRRVQQWIERAAISEGALFRAVPRSRTGKVGERLSERDISRIYQRVGRRAGINVEGISAHSTRVGPAQDLLEAGYSTGEIQQQGRWSSERMVLRYGERILAGRTAMARFKAGNKPHPR